MRRRMKSQKGSSLIETALVLVPMIFSILGVEEVGRAVWSYHTVADSIKYGARYASVHGSRCEDASNSCQNTVSGVVQAISQTAIGLDPAHLQLTLVAGSQTISCSSVTNCLNNSTVWPASPNDAVGRQISITGRYSFTSAISSLWPGQGSSSFVLAAKSTEDIEF